MDDKDQSQIFGTSFIASLLHPMFTFNLATTKTGLALTSVGSAIGGAAIVVTGFFCGLFGGAMIGSAIGSLFGKNAREQDNAQETAMTICSSVGMLAGSIGGVIAATLWLGEPVENKTKDKEPEKTAWNISVGNDFNTRVLKSEKTLVLDAATFTRTAPKPAV